MKKKKRKVPWERHFNKAHFLSVWACTLCQVMLGTNPITHHYRWHIKQCTVFLIHSFIHSSCLILLILPRVTVGRRVKPIPEALGHKAGYTLDRLPIHCRAHKQIRSWNRTFNPEGGRPQCCLCYSTVPPLYFLYFNVIFTVLSVHHLFFLHLNTV